MRDAASLKIKIHSRSRKIVSIRFLNQMTHLTFKEVPETSDAGVCSWWASRDIRII